MLAIFLALVVSGSARAEVFCDGLSTLESQVNYCDENTAFVAPAKACRDRFQAKVKATNKEIEKLFVALMKKANSNAQTGDFQANQKLLGDSETKLADLITQGNGIVTEVDAYQEDFVLPIYEGYEEDFQLDPHKPETQKIFRDKECYGEPMEDLDAVKAEVKIMVKALEKAKVKTASLHKATSGKETNMNSLDGKAALKGKGEGGVNTPVPDAGDSSDVGSTITGTDENKKREQEQPPPPPPK